MFFKNTHLGVIIKSVADWYNEDSIDYLTTLKNLILSESKHLTVNNIENNKLANIPDPKLLKDCTKGAISVYNFIKDNKKIVIVGDYDVDGISSSALITRFFRKINFQNFEVIIPNRFKHGYGLNQSIRNEILNLKPDLIFTVDNGINAKEEEEFYKNNSIKLIVTDHHEPSENLIPEGIVINPKQKTCNYPENILSGVGVVFLFLIELRRILRENNWWLNQTEPNLAQDIDLVVLGTIADQVPITGVNRILINYGFNFINKNLLKSDFYKYLKLLVEFAKTDLINSEVISYSIAPLLNAAGRIESAFSAYKFIIETNNNLIEERLADLQRLNTKRRKIQNSMLKIALSKINYEDKNNVIVVYDESFHEGLTGIVANAIVNKFQKPAIVIAPTLFDYCKGSCRSPKNINLLNLLETCNDELIDFGGHQQAAGIKILKNKINSFINTLNTSTNNSISDNQTILNPDELIIELLPKMINFKLFNMLKVFEPFGTGNQKPLFAIRSISLNYPKFSTNNFTKWQLNNEVELIIFSKYQPQFNKGLWTVIGSFSFRKNRFGGILRFNIINLFLQDSIEKKYIETVGS